LRQGIPDLHRQLPDTEGLLQRMDALIEAAMVDDGVLRVSRGENHTQVGEELPSFVG